MSILVRPDPAGFAQSLGAGLPGQAIAAPAVRLRIMLLGRMEAMAPGGERILPRSRKARALLGMLALEAPRSVSRHAIAELLWSRRGEEQARGSLRQALHELQEALAPAGPGLLLASRETVALAPDSVWTDARALPLLAPDHPQALDLLEAELLPGLDGLDPAFDRWLDARRVALRAAATDIGLGLIATARSPEARAAAARSVLALDPAQEAAWRARIQAEADRGDRAAALAAWEECRRLFADRFGAAPSPETTALADSLRGVPPARERPRPRGIRLAVLPFRALGNAADSELAAGLAEEIAAALGRFRWLILADTSRLPAGSFTGTTEHGELDFVLSGTVQRSGQRARLTLRLTDVRTPETVVWVERFDRSANDLLALQDDIAAEVVARIDPEILLIEASRVLAREPSPSNPFELLLRSLPAIFRLDHQGFRHADTLLSRAIRLDPYYAQAHAWYAYWHIFLVGQGWARDSAEVMARAEALATRAVALDPADAQAVTILGHTRAFLDHRVEEACALHDRALSLNPNLPLAWVFSALAHSYRGDQGEALRRWDRYKRLAPLHPHAFFFDAAKLLPLLMLHRHEEVVTAARQVTQLHPAFSFPLKIWLAALGHLGRRAEATLVQKRLLAIEPDFTLEKARRRAPLQRDSDRAHYEQGLVLAGLR